MDEMMMNKLDDKEMELDNMEMDKVDGGLSGRSRPVKPKSNANSMATNVDETQMELPIGGGHKINV